ncbi:hypothetical protein Aduo_016667 [Ancylostoma duodenale]
MRFFIISLTITSVALCFPTIDDPALLTQEDSGRSNFFELQESVAGTEPSMVAVVEKPTCESFAVCYSDEQCYGGRCLGSFVGRCSCSGCHKFLRCESDSDCGGLKNACDKNVKMCDCDGGYKTAGFPLYIDALMKFCNQKTCTAATADKDCFGLACNPGRCMC